MEKKILCLFVLINTFVFSQVGIRTITPKADLHVNGITQITKDFKTGGSATEKGYSGVDGDFLVSQGPNKPPLWKGTVGLNIPSIVLNSETDTMQHLDPKVFTDISFDRNNYIDSNAIKIGNNNSSFIVLVSGFYLVNFSARCQIKLDGETSEGSLVTSFATYEPAAPSIKKSPFRNTISFNSSFPETVSSNAFSVVYLSKGTIFSIQAYFSKSINFFDRTLSVMYLYN